MSYNRVILVGRLGKDPELRYTQSGEAVCSMTLATQKSWYDKKTEERKEKTEWHRLVVWGNAAKSCGEYLAKGRQIHIEGELQTRKWEDKDGNTRFTTEIKCHTVNFLGSADDGGGKKKSKKKKGKNKSKNPNNNSKGVYDFDEDDIPF